MESLWEMGSVDAPITVHTDKTAEAHSEATKTLAWHRWFLFGPVLLGCLLVIFMAGQDSSTMFYSIRGKEPPTHRQATFVEHRQAETFNHVKKIETWQDVSSAQIMPITVCTYIPVGPYQCACGPLSTHCGVPVKNNQPTNH
jgi:hypothetical protein